MLRPLSSGVRYGLARTMLKRQLDKTKDNFAGHVVHPNWVISFIDFMVCDTLPIEAKRPEYFPLQ
jgi:hypothetical protein